LKQFPAKDITRNTADLWTAATVEPIAITKHRKPRFVVMSMEHYETLVDEVQPQTSIDVANMPDDIGALFDSAVEEHFRDT
jgi:prevent-host-death family protein